MPVWIFPFALAMTFSSANGKDCTPISFDHLQMKVTEAAFTDCVECRQNDLRADTATVPPTFSIPALKCFQKSIERPVRRHRVCQEGRPPVQRTEHAPCPTEEYVSQTAQAFYDVTQCLGIENSEYFFALINRESRFQITAESPTGASCYGQLTAIAMEDVNRRLSGRSRLPHPYNSDEKNCGTVMSHFEPLPTEKRETGGYRKAGPALCRLHSNPYSCLFYSAFYYKQALDRAIRLVDRMDLLIVKVKGKKRSLVFRDQDHFDNYFANRDKGEITSVKRISLIQDKKLAAHAVALAGYNGGPGKVRNIFKSFMNNIKARLWHPSSQRAILSMLFSKIPWGIPKGDLIDTLSNNITSNYRKETGDYATAVLKDYERISSGLAPACGTTIPAKEALRPEGQYHHNGPV